LDQLNDGVRMCKSKLSQGHRNSADSSQCKDKHIG
jgi:hypothetical protein